MPYTGADDSSLPENVRKLSDIKRRAFVHAFNSAMEQHGDESKAFAIAHAAANRAGEVEMPEQPALAEAESLAQRPARGVELRRGTEGDYFLGKRAGEHQPLLVERV